MICLKCLRDVQLFKLPDVSDYLCEDCGRAEYPDAFESYFGKIVHVSDGDAGKGHAKT